MKYLIDGENESTIFKAQRKAEWRIEKLYEYLQISPSYHNAHRAAHGEILERAAIPNDFETVQSVYDDLGSVWDVSAEDWWIKRASKFFKPTIEPTPSLIASIPEQPIRDLSEIDSHHLRAFNDFYKDYGEFWVREYANQLFPDCAMIAVPLKGDPSLMKSKINKIIDSQFNQVKHPPEQGKYSFNNRSRVQKLTLEKYLFAVLLKAANPEYKLADIGDAVTEKYDHQKLDSENQVQEQRNLERQTSEMFTKALRISEWAARLDFTNSSKLNQVCKISATEFAEFTPKFTDVPIVDYIRNEAIKIKATE